MSKKLRIGILGAGWAASSHAAAYSRLPNVTINALWNRTRVRADELAAQLNQPNLRVYERWQDMLEKADIDVISVATSELLRKEPVTMALDRGLHVLVEKPFSVELEDAKAMVEAAKKADAVSAICLNWRYVPGTQVAWRGLQEGWIGRILDIQLMWRFGMSPRAMYEKWPWIDEKTTILAACGSHEFDKARFLTGCEFVRLTGRVLPFSLSQEPDYTAHGTYSLIGELSEGVLGTFKSTLTTGQPDRYFVLNGEDGTLTVTDETVTRQRVGETEPTSIEIPSSEQIPAGVDLIQHAWNRLIADFITAIHNRDKEHTSVPHLATFVDGLRAQEVIGAAQRAEEEQRWVHLDELR